MIKKFKRVLKDRLSKRTLNKLEKALNKLSKQAYQNLIPRDKLFTGISIQTYAFCNYNCEFCPNNKIKRPQGKMKKDVFLKIVRNLSRLNYDGIVSFNLMNEPFLDERLYEFVKTTRKKLPHALIRLNTNSSLISQEKINKFLKLGVNFTINQYKEKDKKNFNFSDLPQEYKNQVSVLDKTHWTINTPYLKNQAGNVPGMEVPEKPIKAFCPRPFESMFIDFRGKALLCCMDWEQNNIMGDINESSLEDIWFNEKYHRVREKLLNYDRSDLLCEECDFIYSSPIKVIKRAFNTIF